jgi:hypothetical protein
LANFEGIYLFLGWKTCFGGFLFWGRSMWGRYCVGRFFFNLENIMSKRKDTGSYEIHFPCCGTVTNRTSIAISTKTLTEEAALDLYNKLNTVVTEIIGPLNQVLLKLDPEINKQFFGTWNDAIERKIMHAYRDKYIKDFLTVDETLEALADV